MNYYKFGYKQREFFFILLISLLLVSCKDDSTGPDESGLPGSFTAEVSGDINDTFSGGALIYSSSFILGMDDNFPCIFMITQSGSYQIYICKLTNGRYVEGEYRIHEDVLTFGTMRTNILDAESLTQYDSVTGELSITSSEPGDLTGDFSFSAEQTLPGTGNAVEIEGSFNAVCDDSQRDLPECE